jgi:hypothetical protein
MSGHTATINMKLRFNVDQGACLRAGLDHPAPTAVIDVNPGQIKLDVRNLIADRLIGIDVCQLWNSDKGTNKSVDPSGNPVRIVADSPTFEGLVKAVLKDAQIVQARQSCHRAIALARPSSGIDLPSPAPVAVVKGPTAPARNGSTPSAESAVTVAKKPRKKRIPLKKTRRKKVAG